MSKQDFSELLALFMEEKVNIIVATVIKIWAH